MATIIQTSLDQSSRADGETEVTQSITIKRPAGEKNRSRGNVGKRQPFVSGRFEGSESEDWMEPSTDGSGARWDGKAGGYLQRLNVWRQRQPACTTAGPRVIGRVGRRGGGMALRTRRGASGPEIDAREKSIMDLRTIGVQTGTLQRKELGNGESDEVLILAVSVRVDGPHQCNMGVSRRRTCVFVALQRAGELQRRRKAHRTSPW
jgi:hypothetical protein